MLCERFEEHLEHAPALSIKKNLQRNPYLSYKMRHKNTWKFLT